MHINNKFVILILALSFSIIANAQKVVYSEPDRDDNKSTNYEVIGRFNKNYLIYKSYRDFHYISIYDADMKMTEKNKLSFLPDNVLSVDFLNYNDFFYLFYQYQKRNIVYNMAVKMDITGKKMSEPVELDTTYVGGWGNNKLNTVIFSDDKQKILSYKINNKSEKQHIVTSALYNKDLTLIHKSIFAVPMPESNDYLSNFKIDNDGDLYFLRASGSKQNDNINKLTFLYKSTESDAPEFYDVALNKIYLDEITLKLDNFNKQVLITSFYSKQRRGNVDGLYSHVWNKQTKNVVMNSFGVFADDFREEARGENGIKTAFNDYYINHIIHKKDGGFIVIAEAVYTSSRGGNNYNRWDYGYGSPTWGSTWGNGYGYYNGYNSGFGYPWNRYGSYNNITRYYSDNIALISYDSTAKIEWTNVIHKSQYDDNSDNFLGYSMINTGDKIHFLYNNEERRQRILTDQYINADGQISRNPTLKNLDKGYEFMPRNAKQVSAKQIIVPCFYRNYVCFAKVEFN